MRYFALSLLAVLAGGCPTGANPDFCTNAADDCGPDRVCNTTTLQCEGIAPSCEPGNHDQCNVAMFPFCGADGTCQRCDAAGADFCGSLDPARAVCRAEGDCVGCISSDDCSGGTPVCDLVTLTCVECADHGDCPSGACDIQNQECVDEANVIRVDPVNGDDVECATTAMPCRTINAALLQVDESKRTIVLAGGTYAESVDINGNNVMVPVALIGPLGNPAAIIDPPDTELPGLLVRNQAIVTADSITVQGARSDVNADGVRCESSSSLVLTRVNLQDNFNYGLEAISCSLTLSRSRLSANRAGGLRITLNSSFIVTSNLISENGGASSPVGGVAIDTGPAPQVFDFNTVVLNSATGAGNASGLRCVGSPLSGIGNIFHGGIGAEQVSEACSMTFSYIDLDPGMQPAGDGNVNPDDPMFTTDNTFHLQPRSPLRDIQGFTPDRVNGEIRVDIDGEPRPQGELLDIGADEVAE